MIIAVIARPNAFVPIFKHYLIKVFGVSQIISSATPEEALAEKSSDHSLVKFVFIDIYFYKASKKEGLEWVPELRKKFPNAKIVGMTGQGSRQSNEHLVSQKGADWFLDKDRVAEDLEAILKA